MVRPDRSLLWNVGSVIVDVAIAADKFYDVLIAHEAILRDRVIWKIEDFGILLMKKGY